MYLIAEDAADLQLIAALVQDAIVRPADCHFDAQARRFVLLMARYCHEAESPQRVRCGLRFEHVLKVQQRGFGGEALALLSLVAEGGDAPVITLVFSGGAALRLTCETTDLLLEDMSEPWPTDRIPRHDV